MPFLPLLALALAAPASPAAIHEITVESFCFPAADHGPFFSYRVTPLPPASVPDPLHADAVRHVRTALSGLGLFDAPTGVAPDLLIDVACGIEPLRTETRTRSIPVRSPPSADVPPGLEPVTYMPVLYRVTVAPKHLAISARTAHAQANVWRVQATISDDNPELEPLLPVLAAALMNLIGRDTQGTTTLKLSPKDADIRFIQSGLASAR